MGAGEPGHVRTGMRDVLPEFGAGGDHELRRDLELGKEFSILLFNAVKRILSVSHQVHFVHDHRDVF